MTQYTARNFSQESYDNNDKAAKDQFTQYITNVKHHLTISTEENYEHDIITQHNGQKHYFELEVKRNYPFTTKENYQFNSVSFLGRKLRLHQIEPFFYVIICHETGYAVGCHSTIIYKDEYRQELTINKYDRKGQDAFYRVPVSKCHFFDINTQRIYTNKMLRDAKLKEEF